MVGNLFRHNAQEVRGWFRGASKLDWWTFLDQHRMNDQNKPSDLI